MDANPAGFQNCVFGELLSDLQVLKVRMPDDAGCKPLPPQGKSSECEFSPSCGSLHWLGFMARLCLSLSYPFSFAIYVGIPQLVAPPPPPAQENCSICSCKQVCSFNCFCSLLCLYVFPYSLFLTRNQVICLV